MKLLIVAAAALIDAHDRILITQRPPGKAMAGLWEFPGGKLEPGETPENALVRELREELDLEVAATDLAPLTFASHTYDDFHLLMPLYTCRRWQGTVKLIDVSAAKFVTAPELSDAAMPAADVPLVRQLQSALSSVADR